MVLQMYSFLPLHKQESLPPTPELSCSAPQLSPPSLCRGGQISSVWDAGSATWIPQSPGKPGLMKKMQPCMSSIWCMAVSGVALLGVFPAELPSNAGQGDCLFSFFLAFGRERCSLLQALPAIERSSEYLFSFLLSLGGGGKGCSLLEIFPAEFAQQCRAKRSPHLLFPFFWEGGMLIA